MLESKFSSLYKAKILFFIPLCLIIITACTVNYFDESLKMQERDVMLFIGLFASAFFIGFVFDIRNMYRVILDQEKITVQYVFRPKREYFHYADIITSESKQAYLKRTSDIAIHDGYHNRIYRTTDGRLLELSPAVFENYGDLIYTISRQTTHLE